MAKRLTDEERAARKAAKRAKIEAELEARKAAAREQQRNAPIFEGQFHLAGVSHEGRAAVIKAEAREDMPVRLVRDRGNTHDKNAVGVYLPSDDMIGFVPREDSRQYAQLLDAGKTCRAWIGAFWEERFGRVPIVRVEFYEPGVAPADDFETAPRPRFVAAPQPGGLPIGWILAGVFVLAALISLAK